MENNTPYDTMPLATEFIQITVPLQASGIELRDKIETQLQNHGEPLRWSITAVEGSMAHVEAVVTVSGLEPQ